MSLAEDTAAEVTPTSPLFFVHIPRSGGTTLGAILQRQYGKAGTFKIDVRGPSGDTSDAWRAFLATKPAVRRELKAIHGHLHFGAHEPHFRGATYVTMFRDPVDRIVSYYHHVLATPTHYLHPLVTSNRMRLRDFVASRASTELDNGQTRLVSGDVAAPVGRCSVDMLETAKRHLVERFALFGLMERFDQSVLLMRAAFRWRMPYYRKVNVSAVRRDVNLVTPDVAEAIRDANPLDVALHAFAKERFDALVARQPTTFRAELVALDAINGLIRRLDRIPRLNARRGA